MLLGHGAELESWSGSPRWVPSCYLVLGYRIFKRLEENFADIA